MSTSSLPTDFACDSYNSSSSRLLSSDSSFVSETGPSSAESSFILSISDSSFSLSKLPCPSESVANELLSISSLLSDSFLFSSSCNSPLEESGFISSSSPFSLDKSSTLFFSLFEPLLSDSFSIFSILSISTLIFSLFNESLLFSIAFTSLGLTAAKLVPVIVAANVHDIIFFTISSPLF